MKTPRSFRLQSAVAALSCLFAFGAAAQSYPSKPVRMIAPFPPGGTSDVVARLIAQKLPQQSGVEMIAIFHAEREMRRRHRRLAPRRQNAARRRQELAAALLRDAGWKVEPPRDLVPDPGDVAGQAGRRLVGAVDEEQGAARRGDARRRTPRRSARPRRRRRPAPTPDRPG